MADGLEVTARLLVTGDRPRGYGLADVTTASGQRSTGSPGSSAERRIRRRRSSRNNRVISPNATDLTDVEFCSSLITDNESTP